MGLIDKIIAGCETKNLAGTGPRDLFDQVLDLINNPQTGEPLGLVDRFLLEGKDFIIHDRWSLTPSSSRRRMVN